MNLPKRYALWFPQPALPINPFCAAPVGIAVLLLLVTQSLPALLIAACLAAVAAYFYFRPPGPFYVELSDEDLVVRHLRTTRVPYSLIVAAGPARYEAGSIMRTIGNGILKWGNWWGSNYPLFGRKGEINPLAVTVTLNRPVIFFPQFSFPRTRVEIPLEDQAEFLAELASRIPAQVQRVEARAVVAPLERRFLSRFSMAVLAFTLVQALLFTGWSLFTSPDIYRTLAAAVFWGIFVGLLVLWLIRNGTRAQ